MELLEIHAAGEPEWLRSVWFNAMSCPRRFRLGLWHLDEMHVKLIRGMVPLEAVPD